MANTRGPTVDHSASARQSTRAVQCVPSLRLPVCPLTRYFAKHALRATPYDRYARQLFEGNHIVLQGNDHPGDHQLCSVPASAGVIPKNDQGSVDYLA